METRELATVMAFSVVLQASLALLIFAIEGVAPGIGVWTIAVSLLVLLAVSGTVATILYWIVQRYMAERAIRTAMMAMKKDEREILRIVMKEREIRQDDLRNHVDFSKSKISALVNNLVEKGAITKTQSGRTNLLQPTDEFQK